MKKIIVFPCPTCGTACVQQRLDPLTVRYIPIQKMEDYSDMEGEWDAPATNPAPGDVGEPRGSEERHMTSSISGAGPTEPTERVCCYGGPVTEQCRRHRICHQWHINEFVDAAKKVMGKPQGPTLSGIQDTSDAVADTGSALPKSASTGEKP